MKNALTYHRTLFATIALLLAVSTPAKSILEMSEALDKLDQDDFAALLGNAKKCLIRRDFNCFESNYNSAKKLASGSGDKAQLSSVLEAAQKEKIAQAEEARRLREAEEAARLAEAEARRAQDEADSSSTTQALLGSVLQGLNTVAQYQNTLRAQDELTQRLTREAMAQKQARADLAQEQANESRRRAEYMRQESARVLAATQQAQAAQARQQEAQLQRQAEDRHRAELRAQEKVASLRAEAERAERARAEKVATAQATSKAESDVAQARGNYLSQLRSGIRLAARHCPDGEGKYYVVGTRPAIKPEKVSCVNVHYEAFCPGQTKGILGVGKNFTGLSTDCYFGDTYAIEPKPACPINEVTIEVRDVRACE
jgi:hypothetical protein